MWRAAASAPGRLCRRAAAPPASRAPRRGHAGAAGGGAEVRVRFAPSPTGALHLGGLRTALYNYLFARQSGGRFFLRIEDTDQTRLVPGSADGIMRLLRWAGVEYDEGPDRPGPYGPYVQSQRLGHYRAHADALLESGAAYRCFCSASRLDDLRAVQERRGLPSVYDRLCDRMTAAESRARLEADEPHVVRLRVPPGETAVEDLVKGEVRFPHRSVDDQVLVKSDGFPTYHLANVVDDGLQRVTHVIRGDEWLPSVPKHVVIYRALGWEPPRFAHLPLILDEQRNKLSKRHGHGSVQRYVDDGCLPEAVLNFVALLGWNPGGTQEVFSLEEMASLFSLERVQRHGASVDMRRLDWLGSEHFKRLVDRPDPGPLLRLLRPALRAAHASPEALARVEDDAFVLQVARGLREKASTALQVAEYSRPFFGDAVDLASAEADAVRQRAWKGEASRRAAQAFLELAERRAAEPGAADHEQLAAWVPGAVQSAAAACGVSSGQVQFPLRFLLTATTVGPSLSTVVALLGLPRVAARLRSGLELSQRW